MSGRKTGSNWGKVSNRKDDTMNEFENKQEYAKNKKRFYELHGKQLRKFQEEEDKKNTIVLITKEQSAEWTKKFYDALVQKEQREKLERKRKQRKKRNRKR